MAVEVGMGYVSIVPEIQGFAQELQGHITGPSQQAGQTGGEAAGEGFTGKLGGFLKGGLVAVGALAAGVLAKGFMNALDQGEINGKLQASLGTTPETASRYGKAAGQLYAHGISDSVEEAAQGVSAVMRAGILPPDATNAQIESITGKVSDLSKTFELDLAQTGNAVGQMLKTGLAKDGTEALDLMTSAMQRMGPRADDLSDTMNEYSTKFRDLGLSGADAMGLMAQGMAAGARDTDVMADALKEFQIRATDGSAASKTAYEAIGLDAEAMTKKIAAGGAGAKEGLQQVLDGLKAIKDPADRSAAAVGLFGTKAEDAGLALYAMDPRTAVAALGETAGAAERMGTALHDNAKTKLEGFKRSFEVGVTNFLGDKVIPSLERAGSVVGSVFGPPLRAAADTAKLFFGTISGAGADVDLSWAGPVIDAGTKVRAVYDEVAGGVRAFGAAFKAGGDDVTSSGFAGVLERAGLVTRNLWDVVANYALPALTSFWGAIAGAVVPVVSGLASILVGVVWPAAMRVYQAISENLKPIFEALSNFVQDRVVPAVQMIGGKLSELVEKARPVIEVVSTVLSWLGRLAADILGTVVPVIIRLAGPVFSELFSGIGRWIGWLGDLIGWIGSVGKKLLEAGRSVADFASSAKDKFAEFIDWCRGLPGRIADAAGDFKNMLVDKGKDLARGIWDGLSGMGGWLKDKLMSWAREYIPGPIADALGIKSPSRVMAARVGRWIPAGIGQGVDEAEPALTAKLRALVTVPRLTIPRPSLPAPAPALAGAGASITVNAHTDASPYEIGRAMAWELRTGGR
ncbi:phage tail tape measure protein [Kitasatospora sp. YST-16]|uniref:phage tail tape measure protein n=1 Tax=Kitasatospora sp. YST-16 TaxID=2998080 RepID=UPI0022845E96|nr:phage tail tape measure protein [Kitasatospora sp. YST-16]WAL76428.1 phage tail tape measure protein [Kitasatospora sp. YST-16]WNW42455.1 phage tail tape measure protein [Streptomyces sp. Li-HN-5-13]